MSTLRRAAHSQGNTHLLLVAALIIAGIAAIGIVSLASDSNSGGAIQVSADDAGGTGGAGGTSNDGGGAVTAGDTRAGQGDVAAQSEECGGTGEPTSEDCALEGTVWDGGTVWP